MSTLGTARRSVIPAAQAFVMAKRDLVLLLAIVAVLFGGVRAPLASAASNAEPNFEVKLDLVAAALDSSGAPTAEVRSAFGLGASPKALAYEYFDTSSLELKNAGWSVRLRHKDGKDLDLDYKKRFAISGENIDAALTEADRQGFDSSDTNYAAQVDWTYEKMTLSFSNKKSESAKGYKGTRLPAESDARKLLVDRIPGKLSNWSERNWGRDQLAASRQHGPVEARDWSGSWQGTDIDLEVVPIRASSGSGTETVIELSFKTDTRDEARTLRDKAIDTLRSRGWLAPTDVLKTDLILTRY